LVNYVVVSAAGLTGLVDLPVEQLGEFGKSLKGHLPRPRFLNHTFWKCAKRGANLLEGVDGWALEATLKNADVGSVNTRTLGDLLLRDSEMLSLRTQNTANGCFEAFAHWQVC
jgi:hypothetical protein